MERFLGELNRTPHVLRRIQGEVIFTPIPLVLASKSTMSGSCQLSVGRRIAVNLTDGTPLQL